MNGKDEVVFFKNQNLSHLSSIITVFEILH